MPKTHLPFIFIEVSSLITDELSDTYTQASLYQPKTHDGKHRTSALFLCYNNACRTTGKNFLP